MTRAITPSAVAYTTRAWRLVSVGPSAVRNFSQGENLRVALHLEHLRLGAAARVVRLYRLDY